MLKSLNSEVVYRLYRPLKGVRSLAVEFETRRDLDIFNAALAKFSKIFGSPLQQLSNTPVKTIDRFFWQPIYNFRHEEITIHAADAFAAHYVVNRDSNSFFSERSNTYRKTANAQLREIKRLIRCPNGNGWGFAPTLATLKLLENTKLNTLRILGAMEVYAEGETTYLERRAFKARCYPRCVVFANVDYGDVDLYYLGDFQDMVIDAETGMVLERKVILDGLVAEEAKVTYLEVDGRLDPALFADLLP